MLEHPKGFDIRHFKSIKGHNAVVSYALDNLEALGEGSSRVVFKLSSKDALKVAYNNKGLAQNEAELDIFTNPKSKPIVARIYDYDTQHKWLVSELVRPLSRREEFEYLVGTDFDAFIWYVKRNSNPALAWRTDGSVNEKSLSFAQAVIDTIKAGDLMFGDVDNIRHWGKTADSRVVLFDYGFTSDVHKKHYFQKTKAA